jgi:putative transcriptional regulator
MAKTKFKSRLAAELHETVRGLHKVGIVDKQTMRDFDVTLLTSVEELSARDIVKMREKAGVSQAVFAQALNITTDYVSKIERGEKKPSGATLKLLSLVRRKGFDAIL